MNTNRKSMLETLLVQVVAFVVLVGCALTLGAS